MTPLTGKVAIVTGSSRGIGRGIAEQLGRDGAAVVVNYSSSKREANEVVEAIAAAGWQEHGNPSQSESGRGYSPSVRRDDAALWSNRYSGQ